MVKLAKYADPQILDDLADAVAEGGTIEDACDRAGISRRTFTNWWQRGKRELERLDAAPDAAPDLIETPFAEFVGRMTQAKAAAKIEALTCVRRAIRGWDDVETTVVEKEITYEHDGEPVIAMQRTTTTKSSRKFAWPAAMTWLERRYPQEFARLMRTELTGADGTPLIPGEADLDELKRRAAEVVERAENVRSLHLVDETRAANGDT